MCACRRMKSRRNGGRAHKAGIGMFATADFFTGRKASQLSHALLKPARGNVRSRRHRDMLNVGEVGDNGGRHDARCFSDMRSNDYAIEPGVRGRIHARWRRRSRCRASARRGRYCAGQISHGADQRGAPAGRHWRVDRFDRIDRKLLVFDMRQQPQENQAQDATRIVSAWR
jgi:hypothetical protein